MSTHSPENHTSEPVGVLNTLKGSLIKDFLAGFLVFLIAMPLCLAIAKASGYPPISGIWTAVVGGVFCSFFSNSQLTIKGPAAGLIVIVAGSVTELGQIFDTDPLQAFRLSLGIGVISGLVQVVFGLFRLGRIIDFFPLAAVHGLLASIGIIIFSKQAYIMLGIDAPKGADPLLLLAYLPGSLSQNVPPIAFIGICSLCILFFFYFVPSGYLKRVPAQLVVLVFAVYAGLLFNLDKNHTYLWPNSFFDPEHPLAYEIGPRFLVDMPEVLKNPSEAFFLPDFRGVLTWVGLKYIILFSVIGSLESLLSTKAIDLLDPWKRKTNMDRDLMAVGLANTTVAFIGGLPMISEIVRSSANINNGARTRAANRFHGLFLLAFVLILPNLIHEIPVASLAAMLVFTGYRLASPDEFVKTYKIGVQQLVVFLGTIITTLATDLLIGIATGVLIQMFLNYINGAPLACTFSSTVREADSDGDGKRIEVGYAAVFSNWMIIRAKIIEAGITNKVVVDLAKAKVVDHSVMEKLHELEKDFQAAGGKLSLTGLESHKPESDHPTATRRRLEPPIGMKPK
jgi:MFS superfamily sulfate permease-like transporter